MTIKQFLNNVIGFLPTDYVENEAGQVVRVLDQEYIACVVLVIVMLFMVFYGSINIIRILSARRKK